MIVIPDNCWPHESRASDPWGAEEGLFDPSNHENYLEFAPDRSLSEGEYEALDRSFMELYFEVIAGEREESCEEFIELSHRLGIVREPHHDRRRYDLPEGAPEERLMWEFVENLVPDIVPLAMDRVLGPWADEAPRRALQRAAVSALCFGQNLDYGGRSIQRWLRDVDRAEVMVRRRIKMVWHTPAMLWDVSGDEWKPMLPLYEYWHPKGEVVGEIAPLREGEESRWVIARVTPTLSGWYCTGAIGLSALPSSLEPLQRRLNLALLRMRRHERRSTIEDCLRERCELLYRHLLWWSWLQEER